MYGLGHGVGCSTLVGFFLPYPLSGAENDQRSKKHCRTGHPSHSEWHANEEMKDSSQNLQRQSGSDSGVCQYPGMKEIYTGCSVCERDRDAIPRTE